MKIECAWCGKAMGETGESGEKRMSHGICQECLDKQAGEIDRNQEGSGSLKHEGAEGSRRPPMTHRRQDSCKD